MASGVKGFTKFILKIAVSMLGPLLTLITPQLKQALSDFVIGLAQQAKATESPFDDALVATLATLLDIELPE